jgi:hypothetical protein
MSFHARKRGFFWREGNMSGQYRVCIAYRTKELPLVEVSKEAKAHADARRTASSCDSGRMTPIGERTRLTSDG